MSKSSSCASQKAMTKAEAVQSREAAMAKDLEEAGWVQTPAGNWKICIYYENNEILRTLHQAHKLQAKLTAIQKKLAETSE